MAQEADTDRSFSPARIKDSISSEKSSGKAKVVCCSLNTVGFLKDSFTINASMGSLMNGDSVFERKPISLIGQ